MDYSIKRYSCAKNDEAFAKIGDLRRIYGDARTANLLGLLEIALKWKKHPMPVVRLAYLLHRITFSPRQPVTVLELLCLGKYGTAPVQTPQAADHALDDYSI